MVLLRRWLLLAALVATTRALPVDTSSKLLDSSVVTSVSVVTGEENGGNGKSDVVRKVTDDLPASTVDMLKPDGFQFYTVDDRGQLITRQMTESEIHSIIAAGGGPFPIETQDPQKVGDSAIGEMKVADVVQNVQNVLKGEMNKPVTAVGTVPTIPGHANDEWSSILPSILGGDAESAPVTLTADEPAQETKRNVTVSEVQPTSAANEEKLQVPGTPEVKPQATLPEAEKPTSVKKPEDVTERPMIQVPVITADSVHSTIKDPSLTETKPVYEMLNTISADEVKDQTPQTNEETAVKLETVPVTEETKTAEVAPTTKTILETEKVTQKLETPSIALEAPPESEKPATEAPKMEATTLAATVEEEISEIEKVLPQAISSIVDELVSESTSGIAGAATEEVKTSEEKKPEAPATGQAAITEEVPKVTESSVDDKTVFEKLPEISATKIEKESGATEAVPTATILVPSPTIIVHEAAISEDDIEQPSEKNGQTEASLTLTTKIDDSVTESATKTETLLTELADSVSSMISQVSEVLPSMLPIPQKSESGDQSVKRVEDGSTVTTEKAEVLSPPKEESKKPEIVMVEIKTPETIQVSDQPAAIEHPEPSTTVKTETEEKPENVKEKIDIVPKDGTKTDVIGSEGEVPIVRIDITETKPTESAEKNENPSESSVVRIQLANPVSKINEMIASAPDVVLSPVEVEQLSFPEKNVLDNSSPQTAGSSLIAGVESESSTEMIKQEDSPEPETPVESGNTEVSLETTSSTDLKSSVETSTDEKSEQVPEKAKIPEVSEATEVVTPEVIAEENGNFATPETEISNTKEEELEKPVEIQNLKDQKPVEATSDEIEPPAKSEEKEKMAESSEKIAEPTTAVTVEKIEETPVKETVEKTSTTPSEVVVITNVEIQPTKASPERNTEPIKGDKVEPLKSEEKPTEETALKEIESGPLTPVKSEAKPGAETLSTEVESKPVTPLKSDEKLEEEKPTEDAESKPMISEKTEEQLVEETPSKEIMSEITTPLKSEDKPEAETSSEDVEIKPLMSEQKPEEEMPSSNVEIEPLKLEEKPVEKTVSKDAEIKPITPLKSEKKPEEGMPSSNVESEPLKLGEKPVEETVSKDAEIKPITPLKSEKKPTEVIPSKKVESGPPKSEEKPVVKTVSKDAEIKPITPLTSETKPEEVTPSINIGSEPVILTKSEEKPAVETPSKDAEIKLITTPLKSEEKPEEETSSKQVENKPEEKPVEKTPVKDAEIKPIAPLKSEEKPVDKTSSNDAEGGPMIALKSEQKPEAEIPSETVESKPATGSVETANNDAPQNLVPVEPAMPAPIQPNQQANTVPNVSTPASKVPEKIETQTVTAVQNTAVTEKQTEVVDANIELPEATQKVKESSISEVKPEVLPTKETKSPVSEDKPEKEIATASQESITPVTPAKDQVPVPLVRVDVSPEKSQPEILTSTETNVDKVSEIPAATESEVPEVNESLKKTEIPVVESSSILPATEVKVPEVDVSAKKTEKPNDDSVVESANAQPVEPAILESSSKPPVEVSDSITEAARVEVSTEVTKPEVLVEKTEESINEPANVIDDEILEAPASTEPATTAGPTVTKVDSVEVAEPVVKIEATPSVKTQEIRIQVNETAVLVTKQKISEKVENEKPSQSAEPAKVPTPVTVSDKQNDKPVVQENLDKIEVESTTSKQEKPTSDPYLMLGEKKPEGVVKTRPNLSEKKPEDKWTLIPQSEPYPIIKQQQAKPSSTESSLVNKNDAETQQPSVPLEAHQSAINLEESTRDLDKDIGEFSKLCNELAFGFWIAANKGLSTARSLALSPFGMTSMLAMVFLGARGPTSGQMNDVLKLDDVVTFNPHLVFQNITDSVNLARGQGIANAAFVRELFADRSKAGRILSFYKERAQQFYDGHIEEVNFATISDLVRRRTNLLVRRQTGGRIRDFVKGNVMSLRSPLAALSANVFQTDCTGASSEGRDGEMYFAVLPAVRQRKLVPVPATVWRSGVLAGYEPGLDATVVSLGGIGSLVSTIFVLPGQQGLAAPGDSLDHLEKRLLEGAVADGVFDRLLKVLIPRMGLEVQVPKFSHRSVVNATAALKRMGLDELFSRHADLKGVNGIGNDLHLADMLQINLFSTCGDEVITGGRHHVEIYPASSLRGAREIAKSTENPEEQEMPKDYDTSREKRSVDNKSNADELSIEDDVGEDRSFRTSLTSMSKGKQTDRPMLKLDRPFLYFVRHNPTGMILHMGRFNPRLMP